MTIWRIFEVTKNLTISEVCRRGNRCSGTWTRTTDTWINSTLVARRQNNFSDEKIHILFLEIENQYGRERRCVVFIVFMRMWCRAIKRSLKLLVRCAIKTEWSNQWSTIYCKRLLYNWLHYLYRGFCCYCFCCKYIKSPLRSRLQNRLCDGNVYWNNFIIRLRADSK